MTDQVQDQDVELDEEIEEAHDPKNAEAQSVDSVKAAEGKAPTAKKRKGDKSNAMAADTLKTGDPDKHTASMQKTSPNTNVKAESIEIDADFSADLNALVEGEATLSEEFKDKAATIFEAAVKSHLAEEVNRLEEEYATQLDEQVAGIRNELVEKVDGYLNYVVEQWMEENRLAVEAGLRAEIAEGFMKSLHTVFEEHYIEVPESKIDVVDELAEANAELEEKFNKATEDAMALAEELVQYKRDAIVLEHAHGLAETQVEKLKSLVENVDFESEEAFAKKVATVKESYFSTKTVTTGDITEETEEGSTPAEVSSMMETYLQAIRKTSK
jgi:hypothetical protein